MNSTLRTCLLLAACVTAMPVTGFAEPDATVGAAAIVAPEAEQVGAPGAPAGPATTPEHTGFAAMFKDFADDIKHLPSMPNLYISAIGGAAALAAHPADKHVTPNLVNASWAHNVFGFGAVLGQSYTLAGASLVVYGTGRYLDDSKLSHVGMDMIEALMMSELLAQPVKYAARRERPDLSDKHSFPSGHAADTFAVATALERHASWKLWVPAYLGASYVAASRLHDNRHYLSDVVFGAAVGTIAGRTVTRPGHSVPFIIATVPGGAEIAYVKRY